MDSLPTRTLWFGMRNEQKIIYIFPAHVIPFLPEKIMSWSQLNILRQRLSGENIKASVWVSELMSQNKSFLIPAQQLIHTAFILKKVCQILVFASANESPIYFFYFLIHNYDWISHDHKMSKLLTWKVQN